MRRGGEAVRLVAEAELEGAEELLVGCVEELLGHLLGGLFDEGAEAVAELLEARGTVGGGGGHGGVLQEARWERITAPTPRLRPGG